ncbi:hypothetical protein [Pelomonas cellulosilytica]|uniref:Uncharacterized protein n=1 Tax=Pelomonas cellulosilytica TaxID=2906762 RepID=A0ABS8Y6C7_9BURK|nr:hypothetical protein [Pelomonas sp. P8]MCE4558240.1 hypothetical protein [Pelomonas sp. P8]
MTFEQEVNSLKQRIARAEHARDRLRASGDQEQYMQACSMVSALDLQLESLLDTQPREEERLPGPNAGS